MFDNENDVTMTDVASSFGIDWASHREGRCVCGWSRIASIKLSKKVFTNCRECGKVVEMNFLEKGYVIIEEEWDS